MCLTTFSSKIRWFSIWKRVNDANQRIGGTNEAVNMSRQCRWMKRIENVSMHCEPKQPTPRGQLSHIAITAIKSKRARLHLTDSVKTNADESQLYSQSRESSEPGIHQTVAKRKLVRPPPYSARITLSFDTSFGFLIGVAVLLWQ